MFMKEHKQEVIAKSPEDRMLEIIKTMPDFDLRKAWKEIKKERSKEHR